jgi:hypothetical protein
MAFRTYVVPWLVVWLCSSPPGPVASRGVASRRTPWRKPRPGFRVHYLRVIAHRCLLDSADQALADLEHGHLEGAAVLIDG